VSELPSGWVKTRLDEVAEVKLGRQRSPKNHTGTRMRPYLRAANVTWHGLDLSDVKKMNFTEEESRVFELQSGDIVMAEASGSAHEVGKPAIWRGQIPGCCFQNTLLRVRSYGLPSEYLLHVLRADAASGRLGDAARGVGIHHLGAQRLAGWTVPVPPISEQSRIVEAIEEQLSRVDSGDQSLGRARILIESLRASVHTAALTGEWPWVEWSRSGSAQNGRAFPSSDYCDEGIRLLRPGNLHASGRLEWTRANTRSLPTRYAQKFPQYIVGPNELVMNLTAQSLKDEFLGRVCLTGQDEHCLLNQRLARVRVDGADPRYMLTVFKSRVFRRFVESLHTGSLIQHLFTKQLAAFRFPLPPSEEQSRIIGEVERQLTLIDVMEGTIDAALKRSGMLRRAILDQAFRGTLVPQDPNDEPASVLLERIARGRAAQKPKRRARAGT
jgi:type I restriction enzyme S subunit